MSAAAGCRVITLFFVSVQQMSYVSQFLGRMLQRLNLLSQLSLLGLLPAQHFMDISHGCGPPDGTLRRVSRGRQRAVVAAALRQ